MITTGRPATARAQVRVLAEQGDAVGVDAHRDVTVQHGGEQRPAGVVGADARARPPTPGCGPASATSSVATTSGQRRADRVGGRPGVAHHPAGRQHGRTRWPARRRPGRSPSRPRRPITPWVYLSSVGPGTGQRAATSASPRTTACGSGSSGPSPMSTRCTGPQRCAASTCTGLQRAERDGRGGRDRRAVDGAGVGVDAAGRVDRQHRHPGRGPRRATSSAAARAQRPAAGEADDAVEHEVRARDRGERRRARPRRPRPPARRRAASPSAWARCGSSSTAVTPTPRRRSSAPAHRASPPLSPAPTSSATRRPPRSAEHPPGDDGEPERGPAHQRARRDPRQHRPLGGADLLDGEDLAHAATLASPAAHRDGAVVGVWSTWMSNLTSVPCTLVTVTVTP